MKNIKKISLMLVIVVLICGWAVSSLASSNTGNAADIFNIERRNTANTAETNNATTNNATTNTNKATLNTNTSNNTNTNQTLPKTGANDTAMWILIAIFGVATVYTYKKVRDYNV